MQTDKKRFCRFCDKDVDNINHRRVVPADFFDKAQLFCVPKRAAEHNKKRDSKKGCAEIYLAVGVQARALQDEILKNGSRREQKDKA